MDDISYPLLSDFWPHGEISQRYGVLRHHDGKSERAIFIIDKRGAIRNSRVYDIDYSPPSEDILQVVREIDPEAASREPVFKRDRVSEPLPHGGIVMYCTRWCPACRRARAWLKARELPYVEVDIDKTPGAADQVMEWAGGDRTTPTFDINSTIIVGFNEVKLLSAIKMLNAQQGEDLD
jgi:glutaredoxin